MATGTGTTTTLLGFSALLLTIGLVRLFELRISRAHQKALVARGAPRVGEPHFRLMVIFHTGLLIAAAAEAWLVRWPVNAALSAVALLLVLAATALRVWVVRTMGPHWNVQIVDSTSLGVVTEGPFRFVRHPNYVAVFVELLALPLVHGAYVTALLGVPLHLFVLAHRIRAEEAVLMADPNYRSAMGDKPRFIPWPRDARSEVTTALGE